VKVISRLDNKVRDVVRAVIIKDNFLQMIFSENDEERQNALEAVLEYLPNLNYYFLGDNQIYLKLIDGTILYVMDVPKEYQGKVAYEIKR